MVSVRSHPSCCRYFFWNPLGSLSKKTQFISNRVSHFLPYIHHHSVNFISFPKEKVQDVHLEYSYDYVTICLFVISFFFSYYGNRQNNKQQPLMET